MKIRVVQIWGFLLTVLGWIFIACSMAMEGWKVTSIGGQGGMSVLDVAWYWSSLWRTCFTDSTAVTNCYDFPVLWSVENYIQIVRGLLMGALTTGMLGFILSLLGMECTYIGGKDKEKNRTLFVGGISHCIAGIAAASGYAVYAVYVSAEFFNPNFDGLKFDLGTPLFLGWAGSALHVAGGIFHLVSVYKIWALAYSAPVLVAPPQPVQEDGPIASTVFSTVSEISSKPSSVSELSSRTNLSTVSGITEKTGHLSKSRRSSKSDQSVRSKMSERSDKSRRSEGSSRSSRSSKSGRSSRDTRSEGSTSERALFIKNSYI
ncbi:claudin-10 [Alosa pseudoharengus]|uniref:claudin-10 n=1 Tax=Alosa pseudoharengus TaxID=34774 RepID=UPI003F8C4B9B